MPKSRIFIISGPTGCGESTITKAIIEKIPNFTRLVTATSRPLRLNEKNGVDYFFFSKEKFENEIKKGNILEHGYISNRDTYYGTYGPYLKEKLKEGFNIIGNLEHKGTIFFKENYDAVTIFIKPDSMDNLKKRLLRREPDISQDELQKRLRNAEDEIKNEEKYYEYTVINAEGKLEEAIEEVKDIIEKNI